MGAFDGPSTWEEVDPQDLERVMVRVTTAAMPSTDNKEIASRLAMQASLLVFPDGNMVWWSSVVLSGHHLD